MFQIVDKCKAQSHLPTSVNEALVVSVLTARIANLDDVPGTVLVKLLKP